MGKNNKYAAPATGSQPDEANTGLDAVSTTDVVGSDTLTTEGAAASAELSAEEVAALSAGSVNTSGNETGPKGDNIVETLAGDQPDLPSTVVSETPVSAPAPAQEAVEEKAQEQAVVSTAIPTPEPIAPSVPLVASPVAIQVPMVQAPAPAPVAAPTPAPAPVVAAPAPVAVASELANRIEALKKTGSDREKAIISFLEHYISSMMPGKPVEDKAGAAHQLTLWRTLQSVVERSSGDEFRKLFSLLLDIFAEHQHKKGVFYDKFVFRFVEHLTFDRDEQKSFLGLINLLILTANRNTRANGLRQIDIARVANAGFSEQGRQNLLSFFR